MLSLEGLFPGYKLQCRSISMKLEYGSYEDTSRHSTSDVTEDTRRSDKRESGPKPATNAHVRRVLGLSFWVS